MTEQPNSPPPPAAPSPLAWPDWHGILDVGASAMVLVAAFLVASFTATNSDLWPHLEYGRLVQAGQATFGVDPFGMTTANRYWTNHAWLPDLVGYSLYLKDTTGSWLVGAKAIAFALAVLALLLVRRPGESLWPWAVGAGLAVLASATFVQLRPFVLNPLFLMLTFVVLYRLEWKAGSYRNPILLALLFALWGNCENGFVLGPIAAGLVLLGEIIQATLLKGRDQHAGAFGPAPPLKPLAIAFVAGTLACMANPHHIHVWRWPSEFLIGLPVDDMLDDGETLNAALGPLNDKYWDVAGRGANRNGLAALLLAVGAVGTMLATIKTVRAAHLLLLLGFLVVGTRQIQLLMPAAFVLAMLFAGHANLLANRIVLQGWGHPPSRLFYLGAGVGRLATTALALVMIPAAWPGWLHPPGANRRVAWAVEPDDGLVAAAKSIIEWRKDGRLAADAKIFAASAEFANHLCFFAPDEKSYVTSRWAYHADELPTYLELRRKLFKYDSLKPIDAAKLTADLAAIDCEAFAAVSRARIEGVRLIDYAQAKGWSVWSFTGRGAIVGVGPRPGPVYQPARDLFGPSVQKLPEGHSLPPAPPRESWADDFLRATKPMSTEIFEVEAKLTYSQILAERNERLVMVPLGGLAVAGARPVFDDELCLPLLAVRHARRAIAETPDDFQPYIALMQTYASRQLPELYPDDAQGNQLGERKQQVMTAGRRILDRLPPPAKANPDQAMKGAAIAQQLADLAGQTNQRDLAYDMFALFRQYYPRGLGLQQVAMRMAEAKTDDQRKQVNDEYKKFLEQLEKQEGMLEQPLINARGGIARQNLTGIAKFVELARNGLYNAAIEEFETAKEEDRPLAMAAQVANFLLNAGQLEKAAPLIKLLRETVEDGTKAGRIDPRERAEVEGMLPNLEIRARCLEGNYRQAADLLERALAKAMPPVPPVVPALEHGTEGAVVASAALGIVPFIHQQNYAYGVYQYQQVIASESRFAFQAGLLAIYDGRPDEARKRLVQSLAPRGERRMNFAWTGFAKRYIAMIDSYRPQ